MTTVEEEEARLRHVYRGLPAQQAAVADGLIVEAARLRVRLDMLWQDILEKGETEMFSQSPNTEPYERERPAARLFNTTDNNYRNVIKQLNGLLSSCTEERDDLMDF